MWPNVATLGSLSKCCTHNVLFVVYLPLLACFVLLALWLVPNAGSVLELGWVRRCGMCGPRGECQWILLLGSGCAEQFSQLISVQLLKHPAFYAGNSAKFQNEKLHVTCVFLTTLQRRIPCSMSYQFPLLCLEYFNIFYGELKAFCQQMCLFTSNIGCGSKQVILLLCAKLSTEF